MSLLRGLSSRGRRALHVAANASSGGVGGALRVDMVPIFDDNYSYIVTDTVAQVSALVDPADPGPVLDAWSTLAQAEQAFELTAIWTTHHHQDHSGGNERIAQQFPGIEVMGPAAEVIPGRTRSLEGGDEFDHGALRVRVMASRGHTSGGISYLVGGPGTPSTLPAAAAVGAGAEDAEAAALFCGDTLFVGGCGRLFEGSAEQMHASLGAMASLDPSTRVFCGHEYTLANLKFASMMDPANEHLARKLDEVMLLRQKSAFSVPSTLRSELMTNPFLRCDDPVVARTVASLAGASLVTEVDVDDEVAVFAALRQLKDKFS